MGLIDDNTRGWFLGELFEAGYLAKDLEWFLDHKPGADDKMCTDWWLVCANSVCEDIQCCIDIYLSENTFISYSLDY